MFTVVIMIFARTRILYLLNIRFATSRRLMPQAIFFSERLKTFMTPHETDKIRANYVIYIHCLYLNVFCKVYLCNLHLLWDLWWATQPLNFVSIVILHNFFEGLDETLWVKLSEPVLQYTMKIHMEVFLLKCTCMMFMSVFQFDLSMLGQWYLLCI